MTTQTATIDGPYDRASAVYPNAAVAHERPEATEAGVAMLLAGGNAVDAAVAAGFAACVVMPASTTIAGSGFMLIRSREGSAVSVEFPARAPFAASPDVYDLDEDNRRTAMMGVSSVLGDANVRGARSVGIPAVVAGLCEAHIRYGRLSIAEVLAPAIELAREGFPIEPELQLQMLQVLPELQESAGVLGTLLTDDGLPWPTVEGSGEPTLVVQPELAATLEAVVGNGADGFYRGAAGKAIVAEVQRRGGLLSMDDLHRTEALVTRPLTMRLGQATIFAPTSPGGGWTELQILGVLARLDGMLDGGCPFDVRAYLEASRLCFADRFHFMGDPDHAEVPLDVLLGDAYLDDLASEVERSRLHSASESVRPRDTLPWHYYASHVPEVFARYRPNLRPTPWEDAAGHSAGLGDSFETTHLSTIDADGMAVSCTLTAAHTFGSRLVVAGVVLDDAMIWFNAAPGAANSIAPWKRPLANMGPLLVQHDDGRVLALGAPGGRRIIDAVSQVTAHWLRGDTLEQATARPRVDGSGSEILVSGRFERERIRTLHDSGYPIRIVEDRDRFCYELARPVAVASMTTGSREAAVQPFVRGSVGGL